MFTSPKNLQKVETFNFLNHRKFKTHENICIQIGQVITVNSYGNLFYDMIFFSIMQYY